jgi:hypothetical protein
MLELEAYETSANLQHEWVHRLLAAASAER